MDESVTRHAPVQEYLLTGEAGFIQRWLRGWQEGWLEGWREGFREGALEGARGVLVRMGRKRFGEPPADILAMIEASNHLIYLETMFERVFEVGSWQEVVGTVGKRKRCKKA